MLLPEKIEAYVVSYNAKDKTQFAVSTLLSSAEKYLSRVTVLNHSQDPYEIEGARMIHFPYNPSLTRAWNTAIGMSLTDWTLVSNDDIIFDDNWFETFLEHHKKVVVWHGASHCFLIHRDCIRKVGWFDEGFTGMYYEDLDYVRRMNNTKVDICYWQLCPMHTKIFHNRFRNSSCFDAHPSNLANHNYMKTKYKSLDLNNFHDKPLFETPNYYWRTPWLLGSQS